MKKADNGVRSNDSVMPLNNDHATAPSQLKNVAAGVNESRRKNNLVIYLTFERNRRCA
jgi:hypothetical protein